MKNRAHGYTIWYAYLDSVSHQIYTYTLYEIVLMSYQCLNVGISITETSNVSVCRPVPQYTHKTFWIPRPTANSHAPTINLSSIPMWRTKVKRQYSLARFKLLSRQEHDREVMENST